MKGPVAVALVAAALAAGCSAPDRQPGTLAADDRRQIDEAAAMLDADSVRLAAVNESTAP